MEIVNDPGTLRGACFPRGAKPVWSARSAPPPEPTARMLISLSKRFVFVANVKTASTSIEAVLRPHADIAISETRFGKHIGIAEMEDRFAFVFKREPLQRFFIFAVIRDPVDLMVSLYSSHHKPEFKGAPNYTGDKSFDEFLADFRTRESWQLRPQIDRLRNKSGRVLVDYLIDFDRLDSQFAKVLALLGLPKARLPAFNESPDVMSARDVPPATRALIEDLYKRDRRLHRLKTGQWLRDPARPAEADMSADPPAASA